MKKITLLGIIILFCFPALSQVTVSLGTPTGAGATNVLLSTSTTSNRYSRTISIYTASEIIAEGGMAGAISKLAWDKQGSGEYTSNDAYIKVYLKHVTNNNWSSVPDWNTEAATASEVFTSSTYSIPTGTGWKDLNFTTPFSWNGTDNIAVLVEWDRSSTPTASINWGRSTTTDANATRVGSSSLNALGAFHINDNRPLIQFTISASSNCAAPISVQSTTITEDSASFSWTASPDETGGYDWEVYENGNVQGTDPTVANGSIATGITNVLVSGLLDNADYDFYVRTICSTGESAFEGPLTFTTIEACTPPTNVQSTIITEDSASFSWTASPDETTGYNWEVYENGDVQGTDPTVISGSVTTGITNVMVQGLQDNNDYDFYVRTICLTGVSAFEGPFTFTTEELGIENSSISGLTFYPNPMEDFINISAHTVLEKIEIYNINGQKLIDRNFSGKSIHINVSNFASGFYFIKVTSNAKTNTLKLVKK